MLGHVEETPAGAQTKENLAKFIKAVEAFNLTPAECLNLMNSKPTTDVEIHLLVEDCEKRLKESEVEDLLKLSADLLYDDEGGYRVLFIVDYVRVRTHTFKTNTR